MLVYYNYFHFQNIFVSFDVNNVLGELHKKRGKKTQGIVIQSKYTRTCVNNDEANCLPASGQGALKCTRDWRVGSMTVVEISI